MSKQEEEEEQVVLVVGACGLDRLLYVPNFPEADSKIRTIDSTEVGGGNAANTACALALLSNAAFITTDNHNEGANNNNAPCKRRIRVKLLTKLGDDRVGQQLTDNLRTLHVDTSSPLYLQQPNSTTSVTTVLVSKTEHTRTCIHTPGSCGELVRDDVESVLLEKGNELFENVVHLHCDSRHTDAAYLLAQEAQKRGISVSVDAEKDRNCPAFDHLVDMCDVLFLNAHQLQTYFEKRTHDWEVQMERTALPDPVLLAGEPAMTQSQHIRLLPVYAKAVLPTFFFERLLDASRPGGLEESLPSSTQSNNGNDERRKQVVLTKGSRGALQVVCTRKTTETYMEERGDRPYQELFVDQKEHDVVQIRHNVTEHTWANMYQELKLRYKICTAGVLPEPTIVDTTGAGDAFIGGYLLIYLFSRQKPENEDNDHHQHNDDARLGLQFGSWVAGLKLSGPGAQSALPRGIDVDEQLGTTVYQVEESLKDLLVSFGAKAG